MNLASLNECDFGCSNEGELSVLGVLHPEWRGIRSSMENHIPNCLLLEDDITFESAKECASIIAASGCRKVVYGALPVSYAFLIREIKKSYPRIEQYITWHGNYMQSNEDYNWESFKGALCLAREGCVKKIGFVKKGMEVLANKLGIETCFYGNYVKHIPEQESIPLVGGPHLGIWAIAPIWRKNPFAMLAACGLIEDAKVYVRGQDSRATEFCSLFGIHLASNSGAVPMEQMPAELAKMNVNLSVTMSECAPMTPLESLSAGVPCLLGPNSHLFEDWKRLFDDLVVPFPDRSAVIAEYIENALCKRADIVAEYIKFAVQYNQKAQQEFNSFLDL